MKRSDLSAYKSESKKVLQGAGSTGHAGRPKKSVAEKRDKKVLLSFTTTEEKQIKEKAGMVPVATYLTAILKESGIFD